MLTNFATGYSATDETFVDMQSNFRGGSMQRGEHCNFVIGCKTRETAPGGYAAASLDSRSATSLTTCAVPVSVMPLVTRRGSR